MQCIREKMDVIDLEDENIDAEVGSQRGGCCCYVLHDSGCGCRVWYCVGHSPCVQHCVSA
jgi:hypothetical protein